MTPEEITKMQADFKAAQEKTAELEKTLADLKKEPAPEPKKDLVDKVGDDNKVKEERAAESKKLEAALHFNLTKDKFILDNKSILPSDMVEIFAQAEKETYANGIDKANATKAAVIKSFFSVQYNLDELTTPSHKVMIQDYLKLTPEARQEKANEIYESIFEPSFQMLKKLKKAEELGKQNKQFGDSTQSDINYKNRMIESSQKRYLGKGK